ncbi:hypothetical protein V1521DRAFT_16085 [Lipomyces starkeyi]
MLEELYTTVSPSCSFIMTVIDDETAIGTSEMVGFSHSWVTTLVSHPVSLQSAICAAAIDIHTRNGNEMDDLSLSEIMASTLKIVTTHLANPAAQAADETIIAIVQLLTTSMLCGDSGTLEVHARGIEQMVQLRGGLVHLGLEGEVAFVITGKVLFYHIVSESQPSSAYLGFARSYTMDIPADATLIAESPLYFPGGKYTTIIWSVSGHTLDILSDMRNLTEAFLKVTDEDHEVGSDPATKDGMGPKFTRTDFQIWAAKLYVRTLCRPSATVAGTAISNDWTYECIRLTAIIYTTALLHRIPFSIASTITTDVRNFAHSLLDAFLKTDDVSWSKLPGCLLWVCLVGSAAARVAAPKVQGCVADHSILNWLMLMAGRTIVMAKSRHEGSVMGALLTMLGVQRYLRSHRQ